MEHAAAWTTPDHRRAATQTAYFHENELPPDVERRRSHIEHFQWLPAVHIYNEEMKRGGAETVVDLLDDPRNFTSELPQTTKPGSGVMLIDRIPFAGWIIASCRGGLDTWRYLDTKLRNWWWRTD